jgi:hypothetical protein
MENGAIWYAIYNLKQTMEWTRDLCLNCKPRIRAPTHVDAPRLYYIGQSQLYYIGQSQLYYIGQSQLYYIDQSQLLSLCLPDSYLHK